MLALFHMSAPQPQPHRRGEIVPLLSLGPQDGLFYEHHAATADDGFTFLFVNPVAGDASQWQAAIGLALRALGHGTVVWNFRGQANSPFAPGTRLDAELIAGDLKRLVTALRPTRPVLVGLSIGGLYAARAYLDGCPAAGLVLVNTLRRIGPRLAWVNDAVVRALEVGGPALMRDLMTPHLMGPDFLVANRASFLRPETRYEPAPADSGAYILATWMGRADWNLPYERLTLPTLVMVGPHDRVFYDPEIVDELQARLPDARRVVVPDAGHMLPFEKPEAFVRALTEFAEAIARRAPSAG